MSLEEIIQKITRIEMELAGVLKANALLMKGMESQCDLMDGLKQKSRQLESENAILKEALQTVVGLLGVVAACVPRP